MTVRLRWRPTGIKPRDGAVTLPARTRPAAPSTLGCLVRIPASPRSVLPPPYGRSDRLGGRRFPPGRRPRRVWPTSAHRHGWRRAPNAFGGASSMVRPARSADSPRPRSSSSPRRCARSNSRSPTAAHDGAASAPPEACRAKGCLERVDRCRSRSAAPGDAIVVGRPQQRRGPRDRVLEQAPIGYPARCPVHTPPARRMLARLRPLAAVPAEQESVAIIESGHGDLVLPEEPGHEPPARWPGRRAAGPLEEQRHA